MSFAEVGFNSWAWAGFVALITSLLATPLVIKLAWTLGIVDDPTKNKQAKVIHTYPVPRGGGLAIFLSVAVASLLFLPIDKHLIGILLGSMLCVGVGLVDDKWNLNPYLRLMLNIVSALVVVGAGIGIAFLSNPFGGIIHLDQPRISFFVWGASHSVWVLSDIFAVLWIVFLMNIVNWSSGIDGQLSGVVPIAAIVIGLLSLKFGGDATQWPIVVLAMILAGAFLGFLPFHFFPQKIMPGYGGTTLAGFLLAVLSILSNAKVGTLVMVLGIPIFDGLFAIARRVALGKSPVWGDRGHLHHRLLDLGWGKRKVVIFYWGVTLVLGILALHLNSQQKVYTMLMIGVAIGGFFLWINYFQIYLKRPGRDSGSKT